MSSLLSSSPAMRAVRAARGPVRAWLHSTRVAQDSSQTLEDWTRQVQARTAKMYDTTDLNKARQLALCLPDARSISAGSRDAGKHTAEAVLALGLGDDAPVGSELVLFNPLLSEHDLGLDGTERTFGPPGGLDQRMWASGSIHFEQGNHLRIGDQLECQVAMEKVEPKSGAKTGNMVLVTRKLVYSNDSGTVSTERRCHVYRKSKPVHERRPAAAPAQSEAPRTAEEAKEEASDFAWDYYATRATLFRYSAATFNAHRIHLDPEYCRNVEGHSDCLVHGPLTATLLMNLVAASAASRLKSFEYRATAPITVEQNIRLRGKWTQNDRKAAQLWALNERGAICMTAKATIY